ncbi:MAG TPA: hypothetical protein VGO86_07900, partial [Candidatus Dormibacteraeota bacterium]
MSLTVSGALTGYLVQQLQFSDAMDQMAKNALLDRQPTMLSDCTRRSAGHCASTQQELIAVLDTNKVAFNLDGDRLRLILLDRPPRFGYRAPAVLYDSYGNVPPGTVLPLGRETTVSGQQVREGHLTLDGQTYLVGAAQAPSAAPHVSWIVLAEPQAQVAAEAAGQLATPILESGAAGLVLAIVVTALLARAFTRPLRELRRAA